MSVFKITMSRKLEAAAVLGLALLPPFSAALAAGEGDLIMAPQVKEMATFTFKPTLETAKLRLILGDMATCQGMGSICDEAYGVDMGPSPDPGKTTTIMQGKLNAMLVKEWPEANIEVQGAKSIKILSTYAELAEDEVLAALASVLEARFAASARFKPEIEKLNVSSNIKLRPATYHIEFRTLQGDQTTNPDWIAKNLSGPQHLTAYCVFEDGLPEKEFTVQATFALQQKLPVPNRALEKGEIIGNDELTTVWIPVGRTAAKFAFENSELVGRRLKRAAVAFRPIDANQVEIPKIVKRGQLLKLVMKGKGLDVTGQVIAQGAAGYGQTVDAIYPATKKRLRVRVLDAQTVEYAF